MIRVIRLHPCYPWEKKAVGRGVTCIRFQIRNFPLAITCSSSSQMSKWRPTQSM